MTAKMKTVLFAAAKIGAALPSPRSCVPRRAAVGFAVSLLPCCETGLLSEHQQLEA